MSLCYQIVLFYHFCVVAIIANSVGTFKTITTGPKPIWNDTSLDKWKKDLLLNYDRFVRPENHDNVTEIKLSLTVTRLETDEARSVVVVDGWIGLQWTDSKLKWVEEEYGGLFVVKIADHEVWQPDIYLYNSVTEGEQLSRVGSKNVIIYPNGFVLWVPSIKLTALCSFNLRYWPFDTQHCSLKFTSWTLGSNQLKYSNFTTLTVEKTISVSSWFVEGNGELVQERYPCCPDSYDKVVFHLNITRKTTPYCAIIVAPAVVCTFLILAQFVLPPYAEEKIIVNGFIVTLLNFFLFYFNRQVFAAGSETPLIVLFYSCCLYLAGVSSVVSVFVYLLSTVEKARPPMRWCMIVQRRLQKWLFVSLDDHTNDWVTVAVCIDRIFLVAYAFIFVVLATVFA